MTTIAVVPHYLDLFPTASDSYRDRVQRLLASHFQDEPWSDWIAASLRHVCLGAPDADSAEVTRRLTQLAQQPVVDVVYEVVEQLFELVPLETPRLEVHLHPGRAVDRGGGLSFAPGKVLLGVAISADWQARIERGLAHEYSHAVRMALWPQDTRHGYGAARSYTVRDYLVFEGLAEVLADALFPHPHIAPAPLAPATEAAYWAYVTPHLDETGWPAYIDYILGAGNPELPEMVGYKRNDCTETRRSRHAVAHVTRPPMAMSIVCRYKDGTLGAVDHRPCTRRVSMPSSPRPYVSARNEGQSFWFLGTLMTLKATSADTAGHFCLIEQLLPPGFAAVVHVHQAEDEAFYILDGTFTFVCGDQTLHATTGAFVFLPRGVPHGFRVDSDTPARVLQISAPAGIERAFVELGEPAQALALPPPRTPDAAELERFAAVSSAYQVEMVGPPPHRPT